MPHDVDLPDPDDLTLSEADRRELIGWTANCVRRLLPVFTAHRPDDDRLAAALAGAEQFQAGHMKVGPMRRLAFGCHAAARDCTDPAAQAVARTCGQAVAVAHMAGHARHIPRYTLKALTPDQLDAELAMQRNTLPLRFRDYVYR